MMPSAPAWLVAESQMPVPSERDIGAINWAAVAGFIAFSPLPEPVPS